MRVYPGYPGDTPGMRGIIYRSGIEMGPLSYRVPVGTPEDNGFGFLQWDYDFISVPLSPICLSADRRIMDLENYSGN